MFPFIMPSTSALADSLLVWNATSSHRTLSVMLIAAIIFLPIIIGYTSWNYYKMRGKVTMEELNNRFSAY
jgi:cytochrome d ubiquinol oxidase subunit II